MGASSSDLVAAFLAKGGKVAKVADDATGGRCYRREGRTSEVVDHLGRSHFYNAEGEPI